MKTAKDKAKELLDRFLDMDFIDDYNQEYWIEYKNAKQCALICVDEQIDFINEMISIDYNIRKIYINELEEVKQELKQAGI